MEHTFTLQCLVVMFVILGSEQCIAHEASGTVSDSYSGLIECRRCPINNELHLEPCWEQSLDHFAEQMELALNRYALALQYVNRWKHFHGKEDEYVGYEARRMKEVLDNLQYSGRDSHGPLSREDVESVFNLALNKTAAYNELYGKEEETIAPLRCPTPCDYYPQVWRTLFIVTVVAFLFSVVLFLVHACWKRTRKESHVLLVGS